MKEALDNAVRQCCVHAIEMFPPEAIRGWRIVGKHTLLHVAAIYDCHEAIPILAKHVGANVRSEYGETVLNVAARTGDAEAGRGGRPDGGEQEERRGQLCISRRPGQPTSPPGPAPVTPSASVAEPPTALQTRSGSLFTRFVFSRASQAATGKG